MLRGEDTPLKLVQAIRSVGKSLPLNSITPASLDEIFHVEIQVDPKTQKEVVLWEDIVQAFEHAVQVRHKSKVIPFLKGSNFITLEPRRIAAVPNTVLDVIVNTPSANMEGSFPKNMSEGSVPVLAQEDDAVGKKVLVLEQEDNTAGKELVLEQEDDTTGEDFVTQDVTTTSTVRRNPVYGLVEQAMENYSHIERPLAYPFARGPHNLLDDLSPDNDDSPAPPHPGNGNNPPSRGPQSETDLDTPREQKDLVQTAINASHGDKDAQVTLGDMYRDGKGVPQDYQAAMDWYLKAAEQGDPAGQRGVGGLYYYGHGVPRDYSAAMDWGLKAANQGHMLAQHSVGLLYLNGQGVLQDDEQAMFWYRKAADQGHAESQRIVGVLYYQGRGVPKDDTQAMEWILKAAKQGIAISQETIGYLYSNGLVVPQDYTKAAEWYRMAADQGHAPAETALENMRKNGHIVG
ncbi:hypothetical protein EC957_008992 [Mortierella hygrophila]|uniref:HCP-like protein n=1 Tax=Mortierella hygrophila TaxID=979708 RepID=A0A9P6K592_9FUNG|nr:hypothetical protein EC957_008992 [Mortierella hygrophila]